jgi:signal peptidase I
VIRRAISVENHCEPDTKTIGDGRSPSLVEHTRRSSAPATASVVARAHAVLSAGMCLALIATFGVRIVRVVGFSMEPTIENHDGLLVDRLAYELGSPRPGDIVSLYHPHDPDRVLIKRVIAESGDEVRIVGGLVYINGKRLCDDYVDSSFRSHENWGPELVPDGSYFVMGDHRNLSSDSREWGLVPTKYIIGKVKLRWWPLQHLTIF